jgi:hypothetical protein
MDLVDSYYQFYGNISELNIIRINSKDKTCYRCKKLAQFMDKKTGNHMCWFHAFLKNNEKNK